MRKFLKTIGVFSMLLTGMGSIGLKVNAEETSYGAETLPKSHVRYDVTEQTTPSGTDFGTNWQENSMPTLLSKSIICDFCFMLMLQVFIRWVFDVHPQNIL